MQKSAVLVPVFALVLALASGARAQDKPADESGSEEAAPAAVEQPVQEVEPVRGVRYRVWLKSGRSMEGVVRARGVFEAREYDGSYRPAGDEERGAGVRFWFPLAQDGFIFMPLSAIDRLEELGELSPDEGRSIARARVEAAHRAERERFHIKARRAAEEAAAQAADAAEVDGEGAVEGEAADEAAAAKAEAAAEVAKADKKAVRLAALLLKYPPTKWTLDSPKEIERRKVVLGLFPSAEEKEFLAVFDDWKVAYEAWAEAEADGDGAGTSKKDEPKRGSVARDR